MTAQNFIIPRTPQAFEYDLILNAHMRFAGRNFTDDAGMVEATGRDVYVIDGSYKNIKITTLNDIELAKIYLSPEWAKKTKALTLRQHLLLKLFCQTTVALLVVHIYFYCSVCAFLLTFEALTV